MQLLKVTVTIVRLPAFGGHGHGVGTEYIFFCTGALGSYDSLRRKSLKIIFFKPSRRTMTKVLHVRSSALGEASNSTKLGLQLIARIPSAVITVRDVGKNPPAIVDQVCSGF